MDINDIVSRLSNPAAQEVRAVVAEIQNEGLQTRIAELDAKIKAAEDMSAKGKGK